MTDVKMFFQNVDNPDQIAPADIGIDGTDFVKEDGIETAIAIALFTDARMPDDDASEVGGTRGGWFGDSVTGGSMGSLLWTLDSRSMTRETLLLAEQYASDAIQRQIIDEGIAESFEVSATSAGENYILNVKIFGPDDNTKLYKYERQWNNQAGI
jgi:phage gp46-like protein